MFLEQCIISDSNLAHLSIPWISNGSVIRMKKEDDYETGRPSLSSLFVRTVPGASSLVCKVMMGYSSKETEGDIFGPQA